MSGSAFRFAMRHDLGSKSGLCAAETSCYSKRIFKRRAVFFRFNELLTESILVYTVKLSHHTTWLEFGKYSACETGRPGLTDQRAVFMAGMRWGREQNSRASATGVANSVTWQAEVRAESICNETGGERRCL